MDAALVDVETLKRCFYRYSNRFDAKPREFMWKPRNRFPTYELVTNRRTKQQVRRFCGYVRINRQIRAEYLDARNTLRAINDHLNEIINKLENTFGPAPLRPVQHLDVPWDRIAHMFRSWYEAFTWCDRKMQQYLTYERPPSDEERMAFLVPTLADSIGVIKKHVDAWQRHPQTSSDIINLAAQTMQDLLRHAKYWCRAINYHIILEDTEKIFETFERVASGVADIDDMVDKYIQGLHADL